MALEELMEMTAGKHQIFFPHGFIDPLTGKKRTRFFVDDKHFDLIKAGAKEQGVGIRRYVEGLLKEGKSPFAEEASEYAKTAGKKETVKVSIGIPYLLRLALRSDFRQKWPAMSFEEWAEFFAWQDGGVKQALSEAFKGEQTKIQHDNPAFHDPDKHLHFSEFVEILSYRFFVKGSTELSLYFTLKDGTAELTKIEWAD
jgi:hypothetical protein